MPSASRTRAAGITWASIVASSRSTGTRCCTHWTASARRSLVDHRRDLLVVGEPLLHVVVQPVLRALADADDRRPDRVQAADELLLVVGEARLDEHDVHPDILSVSPLPSRMRPTRPGQRSPSPPSALAHHGSCRRHPRMRCYRAPPMANVVFVAPYALDATTRFVNAVVGVPDTGSASSAAIRVERFPESVRERLAGHWRPGRLPGPGASWRPASAPLGHAPGRGRPPAGHPREPAGAAGARCASGSASPGMGAEVAQQLPRQGPDEDRVRAGRHPVRPAPAADESRDDVLRVRRGCRPAVRGEAAGRRRGAGHVPRRGRRAARPLAVDQAGPLARRPRACWRSSWSATSTPSTASLIDGQLVWHSIGRYLPTPLERAREPLDPVVRAAAPPHRRVRPYARGIRRRGPRRRGARAAHGVLAPGVVPPAATVRSPSPRSAPAPPARSS